MCHPTALLAMCGYRGWLGSCRPCPVVDALRAFDLLAAAASGTRRALSARTEMHSPRELETANVGQMLYVIAVRMPARIAWAIALEAGLMRKNTR